MNVYCRNEDFIMKNCYLAKENKRYDILYSNTLKFSEFLEAFVRIIDGERADQDLKRLSLDALIDTVINDYFKNGKSLVKQH